MLNTIEEMVREEIIRDKLKDLCITIDVQKSAPLFEGLTSYEIVSLLYLISFAKKGRAITVGGDEKIMQKGAVLLLGKDEARDKRTLRALLNKGWLIEEKGFLYAGKMFNKTKLKEGGARYCLRSGVLKSIYLCKDEKLHKVTGFCMNLIPYINKTFNIPCHNPEEIFLRDLEFLDFWEIGKLTKRSLRWVSQTISEGTTDYKLIDGIFRPFHYCMTMYGDLRMVINPELISTKATSEEVWMARDYSDRTTCIGEAI